jgi:mannobiose 2-epimerase
MASVIETCNTEIMQRMVPFWSALRDTMHGGFIGEYDGNVPVLHADKGSIYHARILWFFSTASRVLAKPAMLEYAEHAYKFIRDVLIDPENGGVYWSVDYTGTPKDTEKHAYALAFTLYGLSAYYRASGSKEALALAEAVFKCIETKCRDKTGDAGYLVQFDRAFTPLTNKKLSETLFTPKTMNTMLHIMEAYTEYFSATSGNDAKAALEYIYMLITDKVLSDSKGRMELFFDAAFVPQSDEKSYGHDIEASWLLTEAARCLGRLEADKARFLHLADATLAEGFDGEALWNENKNGYVNTDRIWWVEAETVVALVNAYELTGDNAYLPKARAVWEYISASLIVNNEWLGGRTKDGTPFTQPLASMWKCPYHNGRMFLEILQRKIEF